MVSSPASNMWHVIIDHPSSSKSPSFISHHLMYHLYHPSSHMIVSSIIIDPHPASSTTFHPRHHTSSPIIRYHPTSIFTHTALSYPRRQGRILRTMMARTRLERMINAATMLTVTTMEMKVVRLAMLLLLMFCQLLCFL